MHALSKLAHSLPHTVIADMVAGGNLAKQDKGYNYIINYLDVTFKNLININSLNLWVRYFPSFAKSIRCKHCSYWEQNTDNNRNIISNNKNIFKNENSFNIHRLMSVTAYKIIEQDLGPNKERVD